MPRKRLIRPPLCVLRPVLQVSRQGGVRQAGGETALAAPANRPRQRHSQRHRRRALEQQLIALAQTRRQTAPGPLLLLALRQLALQRQPHETLLHAARLQNLMQPFQPPSPGAVLDSAVYRRHYRPKIILFRQQRWKALEHIFGFPQFKLNRCVLFGAKQRWAHSRPARCGTELFVGQALIEVEMGPTMTDRQPMGWLMLSHPMIEPGALQLGIETEIRAGHFGCVRRDRIMPCFCGMK